MHVREIDNRLLLAGTAASKAAHTAIGLGSIPDGFLIHLGWALAVMEIYSCSVEKLACSTVHVRHIVLDL